MSAGMWATIGFLLVAFGGFIRIWTKTTPEDPPGVTITHDSTWSWSYCIGDRPVDLYSSGYITRNSAIRAAQQELDRLNAKDQQTS